MLGACRDQVHRQQRSCGPCQLSAICLTPHWLTQQIHKQLGRRASLAMCVMALLFLFGSCVAYLVSWTSTVASASWARAAGQGSR